MKSSTRKKCYAYDMPTNEATSEKFKAGVMQVNRIKVAIIEVALRNTLAV